MEVDRIRASVVALMAALATVAAVAGPWVTAAEAQYFGRNKVQYDAFDFRVLKTEHFDIYYYPEEREAVELAARMAERWYERLTRLFNHEMESRQPIILYADHSDFEQTTALGGTIDEATGGVTEAFKRRVILPMAGPLRETDHVLGHEMVHAFQFDITSRSRQALGGGFPTVLALPLWVAEGMAEYVSLGPIYPLTAMWMHDAARRGTMPSFRELAYNPRAFNPYRYGHAFWAYIAGRWGDPVVGEILKIAGQTRDVGMAITAVLEIPPDALIAEWEQATFAAYDSVVAKTFGPDEYGSVVVSPELGSGRFNIAPVLSPDGERVVFLSEKDLFSIEMFMADARTGAIERKILKTALDPHFESLQFINSSGAWHPNGREFVFAGISKGQPIITIIDTERGKRVREFKIPETGEIFNPAWSPDGKYIAFTANVGGFLDLFILNVETGARRRLTEDPYAELQPAWSPDGRWIAVATDRFSTDLDDLSYGDYQLALIDVESGAVRPVSGTETGKNINPQWSGDGASLFFLSDANGITNIYRVDIEGGEPRQITNLTTGVSGITDLSPAFSVAMDGNSLVFSAFWGDRYTIHRIDDASILAGGPVEPPLTEVNPAVLPPADRPVGDVMAMLSNADLGLPRTSDDFETVKYKAGLSLDYIAPPQVAVGSDRFGTYVGGGTALFWSDILGRHQLSTILQVNGSLQDIAAVVGYQSRQNRWNWGLVVAQVPILTQSFALEGTEQGDVIEHQFRQRQTNREVSGIVSYPLSRVQRLDFSLRYQNIAFDNELTSRTFSGFTGQQIDEVDIQFPSCQQELVPFCSPSPLSLGSATASLVYDNTFFGFTGPILGQRYRFEVAPTIGSLDMIGTLADYRHYIMPIRPYTLAGRILHFGRYGSGGEDPRIFPLFLGYQALIRGYDVGSFEGLECVVPVIDETFVGRPNSGCPVYDQLFGSRMAVTNLELRIPIPQGLGVRNSLGFPPVTLGLFFDAGVAWWSERTALRIGGNNAPWNLVTSYGVAMRVNFFGALLLELDFVHPNDRPTKGWYWQFGLTPGF